jgi:dynein heavy chain
MEDKQFNLGELIGFGVAKFQEEIINVSVTATQEFNLRTQLDEIKLIWSQTDFRVAKHKDRADCFKLTELDVVQGVLDESLTAVSNIMGSRYVKRLQAEAEMWQQRLNLVADTIEAWKEFQRAWLYLDNIFASPDIRRNRARDA